MNITGEDHVVTGGFGVPPDMQQHVGRTAVRHPVLGIHHQRFARQGEEFLDTFDQLDAKHGRRRDDHRAFSAQQRLLHLHQRLPIHQA